MEGTLGGPGAGDGRTTISHEVAEKRLQDKPTDYLCRPGYFSTHAVTGRAGFDLSQPRDSRCKLHKSRCASGAASCVMRGVHPLLHRGQVVDLSAAGRAMLSSQLQRQIGTAHGG